MSANSMQIADIWVVFEETQRDVQMLLRELVDEAIRDKGPESDEGMGYSFGVFPCGEVVLVSSNDPSGIADLIRFAEARSFHVAGHNVLMEDEETTAQTVGVVVGLLQSPEILNSDDGVERSHDYRDCPIVFNTDYEEDLVVGNVCLGKDGVVYVTLVPIEEEGNNEFVGRGTPIDYACSVPAPFGDSEFTRKVARAAGE